MISLVAGLMFVAAFGSRGAETSVYESGERLGIGRAPRRWAGALSRIGAVIIMVFTIGVGVWWVGADPVIRRVEKGELALDAQSKTAGKETFFQSRGWIWRDTAAMIRDNWVTGIGLGAYQTAYPIYSARDHKVVVAQAHNDYLQIVADGGILGALIALWFVFLLARDTVRASRARDSLVAGTALGCAGGLFALMVHSLFDFNLQIPSNALLFLVLTSVVSRAGAGRNESENEKARSGRRPTTRSMVAPT
jgi:O-antigen ligase